MLLLSIQPQKTTVLEEDRDILYKLYTECKDSKDKIRYMALYAISRNFTVEDAAAFVYVEESTVYDWIQRWKSEKNLYDKPRSGRPPKITKDDEKEIRRLIDESNPKKYSIN